jgi:asparagine synthase (glutamine-hydrolysing)
MDFPYVVALWNPFDHQQSAAATHLLSTFTAPPLYKSDFRPGLAMYTGTPSAPYSDCIYLPDGAGMILGTLFDRRTNLRVTARTILSDRALCRDHRSIIGELTRNYWGTYVTFLSDSHTGEWTAARDCSGMIPCYYTTIDGITFLTSDVRNILSPSHWARESGPPLSVRLNWDYLALFLSYSQMQIRATALKDVYELLAGEFIHNSQPQPAVDMAWHPAAFADSHAEVSIENYSARLHDTAQTCMDAWASTHAWVLLNLSGGFDSSLVLALLTQSRFRPNTVCINRFSSGPAEDERRYARLMAHSKNVPLIECPWALSSQSLDATCLTYPYGAKPTLQGLLEPLDNHFFSALQSAHPFDAIWTGEGGDHLFFSLPTPHIVAESMRLQVRHQRLLSTLYGASRITGNSIPYLLYTALLEIFAPTTNLPIARTEQNPFAADHQMVADVAPNPPLHPWTHGLRGVPYAKRLQIALLAEVIHRQRPLPGTQGRKELAPLLSQPLLELCLETPTFVLQCDGRTRGLARRTFASELPPQITGREVKGQTAHVIVGLLDRSRRFLSDTLLDGALAGHGLLNRAVLSTVLREDISLRLDVLFPLSALTAAEAWARSWH